jgi:PAS domain S-box-containing protein
MSKVKDPKDKNSGASSSKAAVTAPQRADAAWMSPEEKLRIIFDSITDGITITDLQGNITDVNQAAVRMGGFSDREEQIGRNGIDFVAPRDRARAIEEFTTVLKKGSGSGTVEYTIVGAKGHEVEAEVSIALLRDSSGKPVGYINVSRNITDRKQMEEVLIASEEKLHTIFESMNDALTVMDLNGTITDANEAAVQLHGFTFKKELIGRKALDFVAEKDRSKALDNSKQIYKEGRGSAIEYTLLTNDGREIEAEFSAALLHDNIGKPAGFMAVSRDITQRKQMEEELRKTAEQLRIMFETIGDMFIVTDMELSIVNSNEAAASLLGYSNKEEIAGKNVPKLIAKEDRTAANKILKQTLKTKEGSGTASIECRFISSGGSEVDVAMTTDLLRDCSGKPLGLTITGRDITERKRMMELLRDSEEKKRLLFQSLQDGIMLVDLSGKVVEANEASLRLLGYTREELIGIDSLSFVAEKDRERGIENAIKLISSKVDEDYIDYTILSLITKDGREVEVEHSTALMRDSSGHPVAIIGISHDITERKRAEEAIRQSEDKLRLTFNAIGDALTVTDLEGNIIEINEVAYRKAGYDRKEDFIGTNGFALVSPEDRERITQDIVQAIKEGRDSATMECKFHPVKGDDYEAELTMSVIRDASGKATGFIAISRDITERKRAEEAIRASEEKLRGIFDTIPDGVTITNMTGNILDLNEAAVRMYRHSNKADLIGRNAIDFCADEYRDKLVLLGMQAIKEGHNIHQVDYRIINEAGEMFDVELYAAALRDSLGNPVAWVNVSRDVTQRKKAEEAVRDSEERYRTLFESSIDGVVVIDAETQKIALANRTALEIFGFDPDEGIPPDINLLDYVHPEDRERAVTAIADDMFDKDTRQVKEFRTITQDGREVWISALGVLINYQGKLSALVTFRNVTEQHRAAHELKRSEETLRLMFESTSDGIIITDQALNIIETNAAAPRLLGYGGKEELIGQSAIPFMSSDKDTESELHTEFSVSQLRDPAGNTTGFIGICRDITERKRAEKKLKETMEELGRSNQELEQFAYVASHDLQEPLRMVSSYTQLLARRYKGQLESDADEFIEYAVDGSNRMMGMIQALLTYSRVGTRGKEFEPTDCEDVISKVLSNLQVAIEEKGAEVTHDPLPTLPADDTQLLQLFQNLLGNAIKFCDEEHPKVHVSATEQDEDWLFSFRDNGIGIDPEFKDRIFVIFQRLHGKGEYKGTGIGLAVCKRIVERHGGRIWVESELGKSATFYFTIPKERKEED